MKKNEHGFSAVEGLLILIIITVISGVGYFVYQARNKTTASLDNTAKSQGDPQKTGVNKSEEKAVEDETTNWKTFTPNSKLYTIKLPDGWTFLHQNDECDCLITKDMVYKKGTPASVVTVQGGRDGLSGLFVAVDASDKASERFSTSFKNEGTIKVGGLTAIKYSYEQASEPEGMEIPKGSKQYFYYIPKNGKFIYASYLVEPNKQNNLELVEKAIHTIQ